MRIIFMKTRTSSKQATSKQAILTIALSSTYMMIIKQRFNLCGRG